MNYCPDCGAPLGVGQKFCRNCGLDIEGSPSDQIQEQPAVLVRGLGRNTVVHLTPEGIACAEIRSPVLLSLAVLTPLVVLSAFYYEIQAGALAVYIMIWVASSALLYDELRWWGVRSLGNEVPTPESKRRTWVVPWRSIQLADWNGKTLWLTAANSRRRLSATFDRECAPLVERTLRSWNVQFSWKPPRFPPRLTRFSTLVLSLFVTGQAILILAAVLPFFPGEEQLYTTIANQTRNQLASTTFAGEFQAIFFNNIQVALGGAIPFLGALTYGIANYNTGRALQAIAITSQPYSVPPYAALIALYLLPHTWVEELAYPVATVAGILAFTKWRTVSPREFNRKLSWGSTKLIMALVGAAAILVAAGLIETLTTFVGYAILALWAPLATLLYAVTRIRKHRLSTHPAGRP